MAYEYYGDFQDAEYEESISGVTADSKRILFLRCRFGHSLLQQQIWFFPVGYILSRENVGVSYDASFDKISFYSDALNAFYPPQNAVTADCDVHNWDGRIKIELRPFEETAISFDYKKCKCKLNISRYATVRTGQSDIGNIKTDFSFEFDTAQPGKELPKYWLALFDFLSFINYGTDIKFDKIILSRKWGSGKLIPCADAYIFSGKGEYQQRSTLNTITVNDIPLDRLGAVFSKIADLRENDKRLVYYFPENYWEGFHVDASRWLVKAMTFEGLFRDCYPDFKQNKKEAFHVSKQKALDALNAVDQSKMSKRERKYFGKCQEQIVHYEGLLEEMLDSIMDKYKDALDDLLSFNLQNYHVNPNVYGEIYSNYRNKIAHGDIEPVGENEVAVYRVLQAAIYFLLLEDTKLDSNTLQVIAKKLFL